MLATHSYVWTNADWIWFNMIQKVGVIKTNSNYTLQEDQLYCSLGFPIYTRSPQHSRNLSAENITRSMNFVAQAMVNWDLWTIGTCEPKDITAQMSITLWTQNLNSTSAMISPTVGGKRGGGAQRGWNSVHEMLNVHGHKTALVL